MRAYSAIPSRIGSGSKVPIHPRNLGARPGREDLVFQVTNRGCDSSWADFEKREERDEEQYKLHYITRIVCHCI